MKNILCKIFGHKITGLHTYRRFAMCERCNKGLKVSYDMTYGETVVDGDYGDQRTFCWCKCGNELCSSGSHVASGIRGDESGSMEVERYRCSSCGRRSMWDFGAPSPIMLEMDEI